MPETFDNSELDIQMKALYGIESNVPASNPELGKLITDLPVVMEMDMDSIKMENIYLMQEKFQLNESVRQDLKDIILVSLSHQK